MDLSDIKIEIDAIAKNREWLQIIRDLICLNPQKYIQLEAILQPSVYKYYIANEIIHIQIPNDSTQNELYDWLESINRPLYVFAGYNRIPNVPIDTLIIYDNSHSLILPPKPQINKIITYFKFDEIFKYCMHFNIKLVVY